MLHNNTPLWWFVYNLTGGEPDNGYVAEDGATSYVAEDGTTFYVQES